jgi:hypothetical protein
MQKLDRHAPQKLIRGSDTSSIYWSSDESEIITPKFAENISFESGGSTVLTHKTDKLRVRCSRAF